MKKLEHLNSNYIGYPCSPSMWIDKPKRQKITEVVLSYGGGMGGTRRTLYLKRTSDIKSNQIQEFEQVDGKKIKINTSFIVSAEDYTIVSAEFLSINGKYWEIENLYKSDPEGTIKKHGVPRSVSFLIEDGTEINLVDHNYNRTYWRESGWI